MARWVGGRGFEVDTVTLDGGARLRVRQYGVVVAYCRTVAEVAEHVDLAELAELIILPGAGARPRG
ncbi:hypothetical protein Sru01_14060 [Sphaerisporangium rufum]|uniref:Transposase n=1 Tax=Sphaerisporangium rufum TaxID=1381558 RepID=A0A919UY15_9ACTN|nr:transposase [Sphaerisporangium rufum]GII76424.1 hypothetical protein Sru01_14060 [Sphaerisporangium rufum]